MRKVFAILLMTTIILYVVGCSNSNSDAKIAELEKRIDNLEKLISSIPTVDLSDEKKENSPDTTSIITPVQESIEEFKTEVIEIKSDVKQGDIVVWGSYEQDNDLKNGKEPIEWIVLYNNGNEALLLSKYALDCEAYHDESKSVTWEESSLRKWLNNEFYENAFDIRERKIIKPLDNKDNVFLLSEFDVVNPDYGFSDDYKETDIKRRCTGTAYAIARGLFIVPFPKATTKTIDGENTCWWWLSSPGMKPGLASRVGYDGYVFSYGEEIIECLGVRPAIVVNLKS